MNENSLESNHRKADNFLECMRKLRLSAGCKRRNRIRMEQQQLLSLCL